MTPIKLDKFLKDVQPQAKAERPMDLNKLGLFHSAPVENGKPILALRFDPKTGSLMPSN